MFTPVFWMPRIGQRPEVALRVRHHDGNPALSRTQAGNAVIRAIRIERILIGSIAAMTITAYFSSWRGSIWIPQDVPVAILAIITVDIISSASTETPAKELFVTIVALIALSSFATGVLFFSLGQLRLGCLSQLRGPCRCRLTRCWPECCHLLMQRLRVRRGQPPWLMSRQ